jgi:hypothetical protein
MRESALCLVLVLTGAAIASSAKADDDRVRLMNETTSYTDVADAFDDGDPFDVNFRIGYEWSRLSGTINREFVPSGADAAGRGLGTYDVSDYVHTRHTLNVGADVGLFHDFAAYLRLPIVLSDNQSLRAASQYDLSEAVHPTPYGRSFDSPTRSGFDRIYLGLAWAPLNQNRRPEVPTWVIMLEAGLPIGSVMQACNPDDDSMTCSSGVSTGFTSLRLEMRLSRRYRYVEVYGGLAGQVQWATKSADLFRPANDLSAYQNPRPPAFGDFTAGLAIIPWENRAKFQRAVIDLRFAWAYMSQGRNFSPLFDALGQYGGQNGAAGPASAGDLGQYVCVDGRVVNTANECGDGRPTPFNGLTDVEAHGAIGGRLGVELQAARYVVFGIATRLAYITPHLLTDTDACDTSVDALGPTQDRVCVPGSDPNPHYRASINEPGQRFGIGGALQVDIMATATAQF